MTNSPGRTAAGNIRETLADKGLTVGWLAEALNMTPDAMEAFLSGREALTVDTVAESANVLQEPVEAFLIGGDK